VAKRVVRIIIYARLPTGHTHEDVDGVFAVLWKTMRGKFTILDNREFTVLAFIIAYFIQFYSSRSVL